MKSAVNSVKPVSRGTAVEEGPAAATAAAGAAAGKTETAGAERRGMEREGAAVRTLSDDGDDKEKVRVWAGTPAAVALAPGAAAPTTARTWA